MSTGEPFTCRKGDDTDDLKTPLQDSVRMPLEEGWAAFLASTWAEGSHMYAHSFLVDKQSLAHALMGDPI